MFCYLDSLTISVPIIYKPDLQSKKLTGFCVMGPLVVKGLINLFTNLQSSSLKQKFHKLYLNSGFQKLINHVKIG